MSDFRIKVSVDLDTKDVKSQLDALNKDYKINAVVDLSKINKQIQTLKKNFQDAFNISSKDTKGLNNLIKALSKLNNETTGGNTTKNVSNLANQYKDLANTVIKLQKQISKGGLGEESLQRTHAQIEKIRAQMDKMYANLSDSQKASIDLFNVKNDNKELVDLNNNLNKIESQISKLENKADGINLDFLSESSKSELLDILDALNKIKAEAKEDIKLDIEVGDALNQLREVSEQINKLQKEANTNAKEYNRLISKQTTALEKSAKGFSGFWDDYKSSIMAISIGDMLGDFTVDALRGVVTTVKDLDAAFTDLRKVSDTPIEGAYYDSIRKEAIQTAKEVGMSSSDVINSMATAMQMGAKNMEEAMAIAKSSMIMANVGEMDADSASQAIATMINAYNLDALKEITVQVKGTAKATTELANAMDMVNYATNNYAIDTNGLTNALADVGSVLNAYGVGLGDSIALITAANESMGDPTKVANGLKSIAINMAGLQTSAKDGSISLNKTAKALDEIAGIDIYADKQSGQVKDMVTLVDELRGKWSSLSEEQQLALSNAIAGKQNAAVFQSLMNNYETFKQLQDEFNQGMHFESATKENEQYIDSIAGKLNKLKETWTSIITTFAKSDLIKGALDVLIGISEVIEKIASSNGLTALSLGIAGLVTGVGKLGKMDKLNDIFEMKGITQDIIGMSTSTTGLFSNFKSGIKVIKDVVTGLGLFGSVGATATTLLTTGLVGLIGYVIAYDKIQSAATEKRMQERRENIASLEKEIDAEKQKIDGVRDIAKEYDTLRSKTNLTAEEQERYLELTRQLAEAFPELVAGYDENGDPILKLNGSLETYIKNLDKALAKQEKLLNSEQNDQADDWEKKEGELKADKYNANEGNLKPTGVAHPKNSTNGSDDYEQFDVEGYLDDLKQMEENEKEIYDKRLKNYEEYEVAIDEVREKYRNKMQKDAHYKNASEKDKEEMEGMLNMADLYSNVTPDEAEEFTEGLAKQKETLVATTDEMGEHAEQINELEEAYAKGEITLDEYTKGMMEIYKAAGKVDNESLGNLLAEAEEYGNITGDLEGVNRQLNEIGGTLEEITGIDKDLWAKVLMPNLEPLEEAEKRFQGFLNLYNTGREHLGKGGLADKLELEWQSLNQLPEDIAKEFAENGTISAEFILEATVDSPTPIKNLVNEFLNDEISPGEIDEHEMYILLSVISEIQNEGEITPETEAKLREILPDEIENDVINSIKIETDVKNEGEIDDFLKTRDELDKDVESEIRVHVDGKEEAEALYDYVMTQDEEKRLEIVSNYGQIKDELYMAGIAVDEIPTEVLINIATNFDADHIAMIAQLYQNYDQETITAFLQIEGAPEALAQCESVDEMMSLIDNYNYTGELKIETEGEEEVEASKQSLNSTEGNYTADLMVHTETGDMDYVTGQIYEIDGKQYICSFNIDTNKNELVEFNGEINSVPEEKTSTINVESDTRGINKIKEEIKSIDNEKVTPEVEPTIKEDKKSSIIDRIKNLFGGGNSTKVEVEATVTKVDTSAISNIKPPTIEILADSSNATLKIDNVKTGLTSIKDKTVKILGDSSNAMSKINNVKTGLNGIKDKTVTIKANASQAISAINSVKSALSGVRNKTVSVSVNKTVTERTVSQSSNARQSTPILTNSSLASVPVSASVSPLSNTPVTISENSSLASVPISAKASSYGNLDASKILPSLDLGISHIKNLEEALERLGGQLDFINEKAEATFGQEKVDLLQQQIPLLREQQKIQEQIANSERSQNNELVNWLSNNGFTFDAIGNITNYNDKLLQMEQNVESLKKKHDELNNVSGDNKNEDAIKSANETYETANETLSKAKKYLDEYFATNNKEITEASKKWWEYENSIRDAEKAIRDLLNAQIQNKIDLISEEVDFLKSKIENLDDSQKVQYLNQQNDLYREQQGLMHELAEQMRGQLATLDQNSDEYIELQKEIINLSTEWWDLESAIKATNEELEELRRNNAIEPLKNSLQEVEYLLDRQSDRLNLIDSQYENATGTERIEGLIKKEQILNEQLASQEEAYRRIYNLAAGLQNDLWQFGFQLDANSLISNYDEVLNSLVGTDDYERAKEYADEYMDVVRGDLIDIQVEANETKNAIADLADEMQEALEEARQQRLEPFKNTLEAIRYELDRVNDRLELLDTSNERSQGKTKIDYLYNQVDLLNEKVKTSQEEFSALYDLIAEAQNDLWQYGFSFDENSLISNYDAILNNLVGSSKYENAKKAADEYMQLMRDDYIENKLSILETQNAIKDLQDEIEKAERELALFSSKNRLAQLNQEFEELSTKLDIIDSKLEYAFGTDKITLMRKEIELLNDQLSLQSKKIDSMHEQAQVYTNSLSKYGFKFNQDGGISNYEEIMETFRDNEQVENIKELCEEYIDLQGEIDDLSSEYNKLEKSVKDVYSEMLDTTEDIEKEITELIEKEYEKRKEEIEKYTDERIALLEKERKQMEELWDEQDYTKSVKEQSDEIMELQKRISILSKDTSIEGQKKLKELAEELTEAQEKLEELTEDKIRDDYSDNVDGEIEKLENEEKEILESLDEKFSEVNIAKMVQEALTSGFIEINGEMQSIQDVLIESINESAEGYSVMAEVIKNQLVSNLNVAVSTSRELLDIYKELDLMELGNVPSFNNTPVTTPNYTGGSKTVSVGDINLTISGNVSDATVEQIEDMIKQACDEMLDEITKNL